MKLPSFWNFNGAVMMLAETPIDDTPDQTIYCPCPSGERIGFIETLTQDEFRLHYPKIFLRMNQYERKE